MSSKAPDDNDLMKEQGAAFTPLSNTAPYEPEPEATPAARRKKQSRRKGTGSLQAKRLMELAEQHGAELFSDEGVSYICATIGRRRATLRVESPEFARLLRNWFYEAHESSATQPAITEARSTLAARACFNDSHRKVYMRTGKAGGALYLDLGTEDGQAVEITAQGWRLVDSPPVYFFRPRGMLPLPLPERGGSLSTLFTFINLPRDVQPLLLGWLIGSLRPDGPFPLLAVHGEQGSGKSTACRMLRELIDPHTAALRSVPRDERGLFIATRHTWLLGFDNLSTLAPWLSDALCCLATGSAYTARELYSDDAEVVFLAKRPILLNGIEELATRADLLDRCILLNLQSIAEDRRRSEAELWTDFRAARPQLFGALLDALSCALRELPNVKLHRSPRMADFAAWATAAEPALGLEPGAFVTAYFQNISAASDLPLEESAIAAPLRVLLEKQGPMLDGSGPTWTGTATELLTALRSCALDEHKRQSNWPKNPQALSGQLRRLAPNLRQKGIQTENSRASDGKRTRIINIRSIPC